MHTGMDGSRFLDLSLLEGTLQLLQRYNVLDFKDGALEIRLNPQPAFLSDKAIEEIKSVSDEKEDVLFDAVPDVSAAE